MLNEFEDIHLGARPELFKRARELRQNQTPAEKLLWKFIRNRQLKGFKFRRQHPIFHFIADFYCHEARLIIELDGKYHEYKLQKMDDAERTESLRRMRIRVIRFRNEEVLEDVNKVLRVIVSLLDDVTSPPTPLQIGEGS